MSVRPPVRKSQKGANVDYFLYLALPLTAWGSWSVVMYCIDVLFCK